MVALLKIIPPIIFSTPVARKIATSRNTTPLIPWLGR
jgi:hypothetical protein